MKLHKLPEGDIMTGTNKKGEFVEIFFLPETEVQKKVSEQQEEIKQMTIKKLKEVK